ncbi:MAG: hypothetical protein REI64_01145 [Pedobacter sp.]|nr:hypothetical protein [Pedobacter sp.]
MADEKINTIAGYKWGEENGDWKNANWARLTNPFAIYAASDGSILFSDLGNNLIRKLTPIRWAYGW